MIITTKKENTQVLLLLSIYATKKSQYIFRNVYLFRKIIKSLSTIFRKRQGVSYYNFNDGKYYEAKVLTTRSNGNIYISIEDGELVVCADKASSNHKKCDEY